MLEPRSNVQAFTCTLGCSLISMHVSRTWGYHIDCMVCQLMHPRSGRCSVWGDGTMRGIWYTSQTEGSICQQWLRWGVGFHTNSIVPELGFSYLWSHQCSQLYAKYVGTLSRIGDFSNASQGILGLEINLFLTESGCISSQWCGCVLSPVVKFITTRSSSIAWNKLTTHMFHLDFPTVGFKLCSKARLAPIPHILSIKKSWALFSWWLEGAIGTSIGMLATVFRSLKCIMPLHI